MPVRSMHKPTDLMAADGHADCNDDNKSKGSQASLRSLQDVDAMMHIRGKQHKIERIANVQTWRWKVQNGRVSDSRYTKEVQLGQDVSKRKAQNRAAQKAFRERQKRAYRDLEVRNEELNASMGEALQEINRLRSLTENMSLEMKAYKDRTLKVQETTEPAVCSAKCRSRVLSPRAITSSPQRQFDKRKSTKRFEHVVNAPYLHLHTNACLFKITATTSDQHDAHFSSASNEAVTTMQSAKQMCVNFGASPNHLIPNHGRLDRNCQASQACISESFPWLSMDATLSADQVDASAGLGSLSCASLHGTESSCANLMNCPSYSYLQQGYDCDNTGSSNFASTPPTDNDTLDTPLTSPDATGNMHQFCTDAPQFCSRSTDANQISGRFSAPFQATPVAFSDLTIPPCFGPGEVDWFEAPY